MKWYIACSGVSELTGGSTPKASQVRKITSVGWPARHGTFALWMNSIGYAPRVFSVMVVSVKSTDRSSSRTTFSSTAPKRLKNIGLVLGRQIDGLGIAAALDIENAIVAPAVLVVANQEALGVRREGRFAG